MELTFSTKMRWRTYQAQLKNCICDLRYHKTSAQKWWDTGVLPELYVITVQHNAKKYPI